MRALTHSNYLISAALDGGTSVMVFILSFAVLGAAGPPKAFRKWGSVQKLMPKRLIGETIITMETLTTAMLGEDLGY